MRDVRFTPTPDGWVAAAMEQLAERRKHSDLLWTETTAEQSCLACLPTIRTAPLRETHRCVLHDAHPFRRIFAAS